MSLRARPSQLPAVAALTTWVTKPGKMGPGTAYCTDCCSEVLDETQRKLDELGAALHPARQPVLPVPQLLG